MYVFYLKRLIITLLCILPAATFFAQSILTNAQVESTGKKTDHGYYVINHTNKQGIKPKTGDRVDLHATLWVADTLLQDTRRISDDPREIEIPDFNEMPAGRKVPAIFDGVLSAAEGDSITIYQELDSALALQLPNRLKTEKYMRFNLVVYDVQTTEELKKLQEAAMARFSEIEAQAGQTIKDYASGSLEKKITTLPSGLKILIKDKGAGAPLKVPSSVKCHYYGALIDGTMFDNSFQRGESLGFMLGTGQMIAGFDEGIQQLNHGGKAFLFLPPHLGYGDQVDPGGPIPPNAELIFYVEVE